MTVNLRAQFQSDHTLLWMNLSRLNATLIIANLSLFFLTHLVTEKGYFYTFYSLFFLGVVQIIGVLPHGLFDRLWFYLLVLCLEAPGVYFLVASCWYWVATSRVPLPH